MSSDIPPGKLNRWCERQGLYSNDDAKLAKARQHLVNKNLSNYEKAALFIHELFGLKGFEFVVFSSARFDKPVTLPRNTTLVPCFLPEEKMKSWKDPLVRLTFAMQHHARFIYDGWVPISDWSFENCRKVIRDINKTLTLFAAQERIWFAWEPKYFPSQLHPSSQKVEDSHIQEVKDLYDNTQTWNFEDSDALYRGLAWLSQSLALPQPVARFLFCIVSIESLATHIERGASNDSVFSSLKTTFPETNQNKEECIRKIMDNLYTDNPIRAISQAYSNCDVSITKMLKSHLSVIFADDPKSFRLMFEGDEDESLYDIRHKIAHGGFDTLSDFERQKIASRVWDVERTARKYFRNVIKKATGKDPFRHKMIKSMSIPFAIGSHEGMYKGPIHMAEFYTYAKG
jgi:hypothetical protein